MTPQRIQMTRRPGGWRHEHPDAVRIDRSTKWGNPFTVAATWRSFPSLTEGQARVMVVRDLEDLVRAGGEHTRSEPGSAGQRQSVTYRYPSIVEIRAELAGRSLACWCPLPAPGEPDVCHGAVLLRVAAGGEP